MTIRTAICVLIAAGQLSTATVAAESPRVLNQIPGQALVASMATWVSKTQALSASATHPSVVLSGRTNRYDPATQTIHLPADWTGETAKEISLLVHEVAQHLQYAAGRRFDCAQDRNAVPYAAQDSWLRMSERSLQSEFGMTADVLLLITQCVP